MLNTALYSSIAFQGIKMRYNKALKKKQFTVRKNPIVSNFVCPYKMIYWDKQSTWLFLQDVIAAAKLNYNCCFF